MTDGIMGDSEEVRVTTQGTKYLCPLSHQEDDQSPLLRHEVNIRVNNDMMAYHICSADPAHRFAHNLGTNKWYGNREVLRG